MDNKRTFEEWCNAINEIAVGYGWPKNTVEETGDDARWFEMWEEELTPADALREEFRE